MKHNDHVYNLKERFKNSLPWFGLKGWIRDCELIRNPNYFVKKMSNVWESVLWEKERRGGTARGEKNELGWCANELGWVNNLGFSFYIYLY